jgi:bifunctional non-homologous end joining protein LigD
VPAADDATWVEVDGRRLRLTHLDKVLYPATGTTKAEVADYLARAAGPLLAQLADRPVTRVRWPHGTGRPGDRFYEKNAPRGAPEWLRTVVVAGDEGPVTHPLLDDVAGLVWAANLAALELHTPQWRVGPHEAADAVRRPDRLVVDLDPGPGTGLAECAAVARVVAERLADDGLTCTPVTSGSKGLQLYAPLSGEQGADVVREHAKRLAEGLARDRPGEVTATMTRAVRTGKVLLDWSQNSGSKTTITPYSLRGRERPWVAAPRRWEELDDGLAQLTADEVLARLATDGDPMPPRAAVGPRLPER